MRFILTFFILITSFNLSAIPHDGKFYRGADAIVAKGGLPGFYQPSQRFPLIQAIQNYRFLGNQGPWNPEIPVHVQSISADANPQTYIDSFIQLLFPSPDEVNLTPNQAESDPLSRLGIDDIVALINFSRNPDTSKEDLRETLFSDVQFPDSIRANYVEFLKYEFVRQIKENIDDMPETTFKTLKVDKSHVHWRSEFLKKVYPSFFTDKKLQSGDIERMAGGGTICQTEKFEKTFK